LAAAAWARCWPTKTKPPFQSRWPSSSSSHSARQVEPFSIRSPAVGQRSPWPSVTVASSQASMCVNLRSSCQLADSQKSPNPPPPRRSVMLVLSRFPGEKVYIITPDGTRLIIQAVEFRQGRMKLGFAAPAGYQINREEVQKRIDAVVSQTAPQPKDAQ